MVNYYLYTVEFFKLFKQYGDVPQGATSFYEEEDSYLFC